MKIYTSPIYTYNDKYTRQFVRQSLKRGRVCAFNQCYKSKLFKIFQNIFSKIIPRELKFEGNVYGIIEVYMKYKIDQLKLIKRDYESRFDKCRDIDEEEMEKYFNENFGEFADHQFLQQLSLNGLFWDFDAISLYTSAMSDEKDV